MRSAITTSRHLKTVPLIGIVLIFFIPVAALFFSAAAPMPQEWTPLLRMTIPGYIGKTLMLLLLVAMGCFFWGTLTAWLVTACDFPGRRLFSWLLILPMTIPSYILAFIYSDALEYAGYVQSTLRTLFDWGKGDYFFPKIRSVGGGAMILTLVSYPYVFLAARSAFLRRIATYIETAQVLGASPAKLFFCAVLPLARPFLMAGVTLAIFETLNAYGSLQLLGVRTISVGIYNAWFILGSRNAATRIALLGVAFVMIFLIIERVSRGAGRRITARGRGMNRSLYRLDNGRKWLAWLFCALPVMAGFLYPLGVLIYYAVNYFSKSFTPRLWGYAVNSLTLGLSGALVCVFLSIFLFAFLDSSRRSGKLLAFTRLSALGYAFPGALIAVGTMHFVSITAWPLIGTLALLIFALALRFHTLSFGLTESAIAEVPPGYDAGVKVLGKGDATLYFRVHLPLIRGSLFAAALIVCVDIMKELPITLILRPFNYETLSTFVFQYAGDELYAESALASLILIAAGQIPIVILSRSLARGGS